MDIARDLRECIGNTPLLELNRLFPGSPARVLAKLELRNPMSIKDRPVLNMIRSAMDRGMIVPGTEVVEASSGNTAIAIASLGTILGFRVRVYMSDLCSLERRKILCAYGARVVITPGVEHTKGARTRAMAYCEEHPGTTFFVNQHGNPDNGRAHELTTGPELWRQTGAGKGNIGIGPGFITENFRRSERNLDEIILVTDEDAYSMTREIARKEGFLVGPTSGASAWVAGQLALREEMEGKNIVCFFYDTGERYLSTEGLFEADNVERVD